MRQELSASWDQHAGTYDDEADHGLRDPGVRQAWKDLLLDVLPTDPTRTIADLGCGTGSLSVLLAEQGHEVYGIDFAPSMLRIAVTKAAAIDPAPKFCVGNAPEPPLAPGSVDVVLCRHVLWAMPDPAAALTNWRRLLRPNGMMILIEGSWSTGAGLTAAACTDLVRGAGCRPVYRRLDDPRLWGGPITDERYLVLATSPPARTGARSMTPSQDQPMAWPESNQR